MIFVKPEKRPSLNPSKWNPHTKADREHTPRSISKTFIKKANPRLNPCAAYREKSRHSLPRRINPSLPRFKYTRESSNNLLAAPLVWVNDSRSVQKTRRHIGARRYISALPLFPPFSSCVLRMFYALQSIAGDVHEKMSRKENPLGPQSFILEI